MSYSIKSIEVFERQARRHSKKYPSLKVELLELVESSSKIPFKERVLEKAVTRFA